MQMERANDQRRLWKYIIFTMLTFGIYGIIFWWNMIKDLNMVCGYVEDSDDNKSPNYIVLILLNLVTFGIYNYFWYYKQGNRIKEAGAAYGKAIEEKGSTYLLWNLLGVWLAGIGPLIGMYLFISNLNKISKMYNYKIENQQGGYDQDPYSQGNNAYVQDNYGYIPDNSYNPDNNYSPNNGYTPNNYNQGGGYNQGNNSPWNESTYYGLQDDGPTRGINTKGGLHCIAGTYMGADIDLPSGMELVIGRNSQMSQLILPEQDISRRHCSIRYENADGYYYVTDYSAFGVVINDSQKMAKGVTTKCSAGTKLTLGSGSNIFILK